MVMLLVLMLVGVSGAWAQTSYGKAEIKSAPNATTGWQTIYDQGNVKAWYQNTTDEAEFIANKGANQLDDKWFIKLAGNGFIKIRVAKGTVVAGDILRVEVRDIYNNGKNQVLGFQVEGSYSTIGITETDNALHTLDYILKDGDIRTDPDEGTCDYIQINRNGNSGCGYHSVEILRNILDDSTFKSWSNIDGNSSTGTATGGAVNTSLGSSVNAGGTVYGDGNVYYLNYVNVKGGSGAIMPDAKCLIIEGNSGVSVRVLFNRSKDNGTVVEGALQESVLTIPSSGKLYFDISSYDTFHLNAIKIPNNESSGNVVNSVKISNYLPTYTVNVNLAGLPTGCDAYFTIGSDGTQYKSAQTVIEGTQVTYTMTSSDPHYTPSGWRTKAWEEPDYGWMGYTASFTTTVRSEAAGTENNEQRLYGNLNPTPEFNKFFFVKAVAETGGTATVTDASGHNTSERYDNTTGELTFTATPNAGYAFDGWYNTAGTKVGTTASWNSGTYGSKNSDVDLVYTAKFKANGAVTHPAVTCQNNTIDLSKITTSGNCSYDSNSKQGSMNESGAYLSVKFTTAQDMHELASFVVDGNNVDKTAGGVFDRVEFICNDSKTFSKYNNPSNTDFNDDQHTALTACTEIRLYSGSTNGSFTINSITLNFGGSHKKKDKPVLNNGTKDGMVVAAGRPFTLSATNGYWREYKSDLSGEKDGGLITGVWASTHKFTSGLSVGDYYFGIQDNENKNCDFGVNHHSDLTTIHVKVVEATPNITSCENAHIDRSKLYVYGNATYNGSTGEFVVNNYNQYGNGLKIVFATPQDLSYAKTITINGAEFKNPNMDEDGISDTRWPNVEAKDGKTVINLNNKGNANYDAITLIDLRDIPAGTYTISSVDVEFDHTPEKPQLVNGTTARMLLPIPKENTVSKNFTLSSNGAFDTYWREYDAINGNMITTRIGSDVYNQPNQNISGLTAGTYYFAAERRRVCEFGITHYATEKTWVTVDVEPEGTMPTELDMIKQPVYGANHASEAKEYLAIANLTANDGKSIPGWGVATATGTDTKNTTDDVISADNEKQKLAYVLGIHNYTVNATDGLCISQYGRAGLVAGQTEIPTRATLMFKAAGTEDFYLLAKNMLPKSGTDDKGNPVFTNADRRHIKVWYTNDQNVDASGNRILMPLICANNNTDNDLWFYGERKEDWSGDGAPLSFGVRLQHLGKDGTCNIYITYEDDAVDNNVWIKGILVKRPDLKVTIGRTDNLYYKENKYGKEDLDKQVRDNCKVTCFGENQPYQWNFGTAGFYALTDPNAGTGASNEIKKENTYDGRTYICGVGPHGEQLIDHVLVYSDGKGQVKANFDGRKETNGTHNDDKGVAYPDDYNEHIEFNHATIYSGKNTYNTDQQGFDENRRAFFPILSNGLKVNVTGSGWFTIACTAPNGAVKMRVLSSTNGGNAYMNVLREFIVEPSSKPNKDTDWQTYRVYLKAHAEKDGDQGFWHGHFKDKDEAYGKEISKLDPEETQMSLYVVFDALKDESAYEEGHSQLNIHFMQWINEMPVDYVFQREEDPALLNSLQSITSNETDTKPTLYWQAGNNNMFEEHDTKTPAYKEGENNHPSVTYGSAFNSAGQQDRQVGQRSGHGFVSNEDRLACEWNVAALAHSAAHTEVAYKNNAKNYSSNATNVYSTDQANGAVADQNLEFAIPISGSFFRFMPMKNQFISTWIVPQPDKNGDETEKTAKIYVLDETGKPIPYLQGADTKNNLAGVTQEARERGWVHNASNGLRKPGNTAIFETEKFNEQTAAVRIDFGALAGKEYFIVSDNGTIGLARMKVSGNDDRAAMEEINGAVTLKDGTKNDYIDGSNATAISNAMNSKPLEGGKYARYASEDNAITLEGRTFTQGTWASLVLPFSLNEKKLEEVFGAGTKCMHFTKVDKGNNTIYLTQHFYNMVVAGRPVFICPGETVENPVFTDVTLQASTVTPTVTDGFTFVASYDNQTINNYDLYLNTKNSFNYLKVGEGHMTYPGMRSFIQNNCNWDFSEGKPQTSSGAKARFLNFYDEDEGFSTGIEELITQEFGEDVTVITKSTKVYDLKGRIVANGSNIDNLPAGIYLVNGKKYLVK